MQLFHQPVFRCRDMSKNCSGPFAHKDTDFTFDLNHQPGNEFDT